MQARTPYLILMAILAGCGTTSDGPKRDDAPVPEAGKICVTEVAKKSGMFAEVWSKYDNPAKLGDFEYNLAKLPTSGEVAVIPWVGSPWPAYADSINYRWAGPGSEAASLKYERAFGGSNIENAVSRAHGVGTSTGPVCESDRQCGSQSRCGLRAGATKGRCTPAWWGINHGWAAAATLHPEPRHAVQHEGVTFEVQDIKALLSIAYDVADTTQVSLRCQEPPKLLTVDKAARPTSSACRDTNPGTYHVLLANLIGLQNKSFIEDRAVDRDVWNVPIRAYEVLAQREITRKEALQVLGVGNSDYPYNARATRWAYVKTEVNFIQEARPEAIDYIGDGVDRHTRSDVYEYVLELDDEATIIGGEWLGKSKLDHPDFVWMAHGPKAESVARIRVADVLELARKSIE